MDIILKQTGKNVVPIEWGTEMLMGAGVALLTSLAWAISSIILKFLTDSIDTLTINTLRMWVGAILLITIACVTGRQMVLQAIPLQSMSYIILSGILAMAIGDTLYIKCLALLDASMAFPISQCAFVVLASFAAILLLNEPFTPITMAGGLLVVYGIYLIVAIRERTPGTGGVKRVDKKGVIIALLAAVIWTASTIALKAGSEGIDPILVAAVRISVSAVALSIIAAPQGRKRFRVLEAQGLKGVSLIAAAGVSTYGVAAVGYVSALQMIGAGKTVLLTTSAPLFALPFSIVILKERPTRSTIWGISISVAGVCLVVI